ncbi:src kinase-associated phosphoprotein 1 [Leptodactylus fuscus]|uniref:src kinase-associated phosphoprotein 1 n=1 Tax=Leptodactylus fuscus TaxID=238119 RepID=UPI003F4E9503
MTQSSDIPRDVVILLRDAESFLFTCLQHEPVSYQAREIGEEILEDFRELRNRYPLDFQLRDDEVDGVTQGQDSYDDNRSLSHGTASDEVSLPSDYLDEDEPGKILKQGCLEKRNRDHGFFGSEWQKRWCVLTNISFCYYSNEKDFVAKKVPKGGFLIKDCGAQLVSNVRKDSRRDSCFELVSPGNRSYEFTAGSPMEARDWVEQIQFLVKDIISPSIPCEDDEESYDDVDSLNSSHMIHPPPLYRANSPTEDDDIYEVVPELDQIVKLRVKVSVRQQGAVMGNFIEWKIESNCYIKTQLLRDFSVVPSTLSLFRVRAQLCRRLLVSAPLVLLPQLAGVFSLDSQCQLGARERRIILIAVPFYLTGEEEENEGESVINYADYYQGLWNCKSDKSDELSFQRGDIIRILSKEYNAYGWWVGELHGMIGIVPKEYLQAAFELR